MNVILFHIDKYHEKNYEYFPIYKKCFERLYDEFKDDKIYIFHSLDEVYSSFPGIEEELKDYQDFLLKDKYGMLVTDLLRLLISHYLEDYIYLDSDIYVYKGFKNILKSLITEKVNYLCLDTYSSAIFYSKKRTVFLDKFIDRTFLDRDYSYDVEMNLKLKFNEVPSLFNMISHQYFIHFHSLDFIRFHIDNIVYLKKEENISLIRKYVFMRPHILVASKKYAAFKDDNGFYKEYYFKDSGITYEDLIASCNDCGKKKFEISYETLS